MAKLASLFVLTAVVISLAWSSGPAPVSAPAAESAPHPVEEFTFSAATPESQGVSSEALDQLAEAVRGYVEREEIVGAELVVIKNRHVVLHEAFGWRDREESVPMRLNTIFNLRSMTKPLTGAAIAVLADSGLLSYEDRVSDVVPEFRTPASQEITIGQLLTHRGGLPLTILATADEYPDLLSMANAVGERGPEIEPGSKFWYSDAGADTLGAIVEIVSQSTLEAFVRESLLTPLGMHDTFAYTSSTPADDPRVERIAALYMGRTGEWMRSWTPDDPFYPFAWGSQSLYGTPLDYARFLCMWLDGGQAGGTRLLSSDLVDEALTPVSRMRSLGSDSPMPAGFHDLETCYGQMSTLHVETDASGGRTPRVIGHSGSDGTWAWAWPDEDLIVLYFTQSRGNLTGMRLEAEIDRLLVHPELQEANEAARVEHADVLGPYVARLSGSLYAEYRLTIQNGYLALQVPEGLALELMPADESGWRTSRSIPTLSVAYTHDDTGDIIGLRVRDGGQIIELTRGEAPDEPPLDMAVVQDYLGTYLDEATGTSVQVLIQNEHLAVLVPGVDVAYELYPPDDDGWWALRLNPAVTVRFNRDAAGNVISYTARSPQGMEDRIRVPDGDDPSD